jgi:hypothetical protein
MARYERVISAENVLRGEVDAEKAQGLVASEALSVIEKLINHNKENEWSAKEAKNVCAFLDVRGGEQMVYFWNALSKTQRLENIKLIHKRIGTKVVELVRTARGLAN